MQPTLTKSIRAQIAACRALLDELEGLLEFVENPKTRTSDAVKAARKLPALLGRFASSADDIMVDKAEA